jgi:hypothetical protein
VTLVALSVFAFVLLYGRVFFVLFDISAEDGFALSAFISFPLAFAQILIWQRFVLGVVFPPLRQALLHQRTAFRRWEVKAVFALYLLTAALMYIDYLNSLASLVSVSLIIVSLYAMAVVVEAMLYMAKDERVMHPFRQTYSK